VVLHLGEQDLVAGLEVRVAPGVGDEINAFRGAAREYDFVSTSGLDEVGDTGSAGFECGGGAITQFMDAPMHVGVVALVVVDEGVNEARGF